MRGASALLLALVLSAFARSAQAAELSIKILVHQDFPLQMIGATAAWAVDPSIVDASAANGNVTIFGRSAGRTKVVVVALAGEQTFDVTVTERNAPAVAAPHSRDTGLAEVRYSSGQRELQNRVVVVQEQKNRRTEASIQTGHYSGEPLGGRARTTIPAASYRIFRGDRELTFFDRIVDHSPLTLSSTSLRGVHYLDQHWRLHAGYTAYAAYRSFLLPVERETVLAAAYAVPFGARGTLTPGVFAYPGRGTVLSLLYDFARRDALAARAEIGYSHGLGAAAELAYDDADDRLRVNARYRPKSFAVVGPGDLRGLFADASWSHSYGLGSIASFSFSSSDYAAFDGRTVSASADVDHHLAGRVSITGGGSWGTFGGARSFTVPVGLRVDGTRFGAGALVRYAESSATNRGGYGGRISARATLGHIYASGYFDRQQNAPTLELIFREQPELSQALEDLGIRATSPSDIARALREHAELIAFGYVEGVSVNLAPVRSQLGFELAWLAGGRNQLRAHFLRNVIESVATRTETQMATLTYARQLTGVTDFFASYSYRRTQRRGDPAILDPIVEVGVRHRFDGLPALLPGGSGTISGAVLLDDDVDGVADGRGVAGAEVALDGGRTTTTGRNGSFSFGGVGNGAHRVVARIPSRPDAYFTTPSRVEAEPGDRVTFGVAYTPARAFGRVVSDGGAGIAGVRVVLARGEKQIEVTTDSEGRFALAAAPGEWQLSLLVASLPAGYSPAGGEGRTVQLDRLQPLESAFTLRAFRSISGRVGALMEILVEPLGTRLRADAEGHYTVRSLPPGRIMLVSGGERRQVVLPDGPASLIVDFSTAVARYPGTSTKNGKP